MKTNNKRKWKHNINRNIKLGDYVLASHYIDADPKDPWRAGFVCQIIRTWIDDSMGYVIGESDGTCSDKRIYRHARKITKKEGELWLKENASK